MFGPKQPGQVPFQTAGFKVSHDLSVGRLLYKHFVPGRHEEANFSVSISGRGNLSNRLPDDLFHLIMLSRN